jgi:hypothetical protein
LEFKQFFIQMELKKYDEQYKNGKIYKIIDTRLDTVIYIGSTKHTLDFRWEKHITKSKQKPTRKIYKHISSNWDVFKIVLVENFPCNNKDELEYRETFWIRQFKPMCNIKMRRTRKQYRLDTAEHIKQKKHDDYVKNKEKNKEKYAKYREANREKNRLYKKEYDRLNKLKLGQPKVSN